MAIHTALCDILRTEHPIIQGPLGGPWPPSVGLAAAVSEAGALGSLPTALRLPDQVREDVARLRDLTRRPFAINHTMSHTVRQALQAAEIGVDAIIAQGGEAGGFGGAPGTIVLVPQVAEAVHPIPVAAAGGIGDGRGLAAALALGAAGVNVGTRFLASVEAEVD
jgi:nitronate monooxygenase/enoyl-[acyl-carrier protein] reductase II